MGEFGGEYAIALAYTDARNGELKTFMAYTDATKARRFFTINCHECKIRKFQSNGSTRHHTSGE
jgi:hypothetical protein